jgi:hypothetical protein
LDQKAQSVIRHDKLGDYKTLHQSPSLTHPQPEAKEKLITGMHRYIHSDTHTEKCTKKLANRQKSEQRDRMAKGEAGKVHSRKLQ